ncbi:MAG TPA: XRE family transcriptional regulator [Rhizomicrobium sp.]|jgi:transcriptional regulator with XRE-family HTH domain|nr:XRE family transcriptional regulator [Rhizomicrobium sp.]
MDTLVNDTEAGIARRIRLERDARNWSLAELADKSGVAKASISKIERGEMSPSAGILVRLASAFDLTLAGLLLRAEEAARLTRAADQPVWRDPGTGYVRHQIFNRPDHPLEMVRVELPPGQSASFPAWSYARTRHVVWVQKGELALTEGNDRNVLKAGDSLGFGPPSDVTYANESNKPCSYVVALVRT